MGCYLNIYIKQYNKVLVNNSKSICFITTCYKKCFILKAERYIVKNNTVFGAKTWI